jgi:MFS family permease
MEWAGANRTVAATVAGLLGVGSLCGKLMSGWLVDRITSGLLRFAIFALPAVGYLLIWQSNGVFLLLALGGLFMGFGSGGALQMGTYLTTRYGGMRNFGTIFGVISSAMGLSGGIGPVVSGWIYDMTGSYALVLMIAIPSVLAAGLLLIGLGAYPQFEAVGREEDK